MTPVERSQGSGIAAVCVALVGFSWGFLLVKLIDLPAPVLAFWRVLIGAGTLGAVAVVWRVPWPSAWRDVVIAGLCFGVHQLLFIEATHRTSIGTVALLSTMQPLPVALLSHRLVGEKVKGSFFIWVVLALIGVAVVLHANVGDQSRTLSGDVLAVLNLFLLTGYTLFSKRARMAGAHTLTLTAAMLGVSLIVITPVALWVGVRLPSRPEWGYLLLLALGSGNGHLLVNWAHSRVRAALLVLLMSALPVLAALWAHLVLGEPFGAGHVVGMVLVIAAIELARRSDARGAPA